MALREGIVDDGSTWRERRARSGRKVKTPEEIAKRQAERHAREWKPRAKPDRQRTDEETVLIGGKMSGVSKAKGGAKKAAHQEAAQARRDLDRMGKENGWW